MEILGTNWYHLCDEPNGEVLVVSSRQRVPEGQLIEVSGRLKIEHEVGGVYRFPLFISEAALAGEAVEDALPATAPGVVNL